MTDENGIDRTIPTPQHEWEPPRLYPGTRTVNAAWRLALMGYPVDWMDIPAEQLHALRLGTMYRPRSFKIEAARRWWNKQGVIATGNAQNCRNVEVLALAMVDSIVGGDQEATR